MRDRLEEAHREALRCHIGERSRAQGAERCRGGHRVTPVQDTLEPARRARRARRARIMSRAWLRGYLIFSDLLGRFDAHGTAKLEDGGRPYGPTQAIG